ncbi:MAG: hypothetical protein WCL39_00880 [Armatimonadota bacterium]
MPEERSGSEIKHIGLYLVVMICEICTVAAALALLIATATRSANVSRQP